LALLNSTRSSQPSCFLAYLRASAGRWSATTALISSLRYAHMLPMLYAPGPQGALGERQPFSPLPPFAAVADVWNDAAATARAFWQHIAADTRVSRLPTVIHALVDDFSMNYSG
jgi:hypothetical protein